ncbi:hypothetical protein M222_2093 [Enterococcus faecalis AZ19]|nr:hypothetical protein M222_2093 [Enterococcus faecalis AZ19]
MTTVRLLLNEVAEFKTYLELKNNGLNVMYVNGLLLRIQVVSLVNLSNGPLLLFEISAWLITTGLTYINVILLNKV